MRQCLPAAVQRLPEYGTYLAVDDVPGFGIRSFQDGPPRSAPPDVRRLPTMMNHHQLEPLLTVTLDAVPSAGRGEVRLQLLAIEGVEAGRAKFQRLVTDLVKTVRPEAREVDANPGDWGIDTFVGQIADGSIDVWQSKFFIDGVRESQKNQIRQAFRSACSSAAIHGFALNHWTLVIPRPMDGPTAIWWDRWKARQSQATGVVLSLWDDADLRGLLIRDEMRAIRRQYFGPLPGEESRHPLDLSTPRSGTGNSLFAFADQIVQLMGRNDELDELNDFMRSEARFAWWLWSGPAGAGKSRLALEVCQRLDGDWNRGFLSEIPSLDERDLLFGAPTLIVIDYAAQRATEVSSLLLALARRQDQLTVPVRVLLLERLASGTWWTVLQRLHRASESAEVVASMFALPRDLGPLAERELMAVIRATANHLGQTINDAKCGEIAEHAHAIDDRGRPLFASIAAVDSLEGRSHGGTRDQVLGEVLRRLNAQTAASIASDGLLRRVRNLLALSTAVGGLTTDDYVLLRAEPDCGDLIPSAVADISARRLDELLQGIEPDIVGELYVLEDIATPGLESAEAKAIVRRGLGSVSRPVLRVH